MKVSHLIELLQEFQRVHGDLPAFAVHQYQDEDERTRRDEFEFDDLKRVRNGTTCFVQLVKL